MDRERRREAGEPVSDDEDEDDVRGNQTGTINTATDGGLTDRNKTPSKPEFNETESLAKFDDREENAIVKIPGEIVSDIDADWPMTPDEEHDFIERTLNVAE